MKTIILFVLALTTSACVRPAYVPKNADSEVVTAAVVAVSVIGIGLVAASGSQGPE